MRSQHIDGSAVIFAVFIRSPPGALRQIHHTGQNAFGDPLGNEGGAARIEHSDQVAIGNPWLPASVDSLEELIFRHKTEQPL